MNTKKMNLADQKYLMNCYPDRIVLQYLKLSLDMACWLLDNPSDFHDELMKKYNAGEIYYNDLVSILEREENSRTLFGINEMGNIINRKTGEYFPEKMEPGVNINIRPISKQDIEDEYAKNWIRKLNVLGEERGIWVIPIHCPEFGEHGYGCWVDNKLEGVTSVETYLSPFYISNFCINTANQKSRIGSILLNYIVSIFGDVPLRLRVRVANTPAIQMYRKFGIVVTGTHDNIYSYTMIRKAR